LVLHSSHCTFCRPIDGRRQRLAVVCVVAKVWQRTPRRIWFCDAEVRSSEFVRCEVCKRRHAQLETFVLRVHRADIVDVYFEDLESLFLFDGGAIPLSMGGFEVVPLLRVILWLRPRDDAGKDASGTDLTQHFRGYENI